MSKYVARYTRTYTEVFTEDIECSSLTEAYVHAKERFANLDDGEDSLKWDTDYDLCSLPVCSEITDPAGVHHVFAELPADLAVVARQSTDADVIDTDDNTWEGAVDDDLGQRDKELFGPVL